MRILYNPNHSLSNIICRIAHKISQGNSGGRARGFFVKNYLHQLSKIIVNLQPRAGVFHNYRILSLAKQDPLGVKLFCAIVQIKLDMRTRCAYNGAGLFRFVTPLAYWRRLRAFKIILSTPAKKT